VPVIGDHKLADARAVVEQERERGVRGPVIERNFGADESRDLILLVGNGRGRTNGRVTVISGLLSGAYVPRQATQ